MKYFIDPKDISGPSFYVAHSGEAAFYHYEIPVKSAILRSLKNNGVFFDVGANIGLISFFIATFRPDSKIVSFEPDETTSSCVRENILLLKKKNMELVRKGVSQFSKNGHTFYIDDRSSGGNSLEESAIKDIRKAVTIDLISLDDYVISSGIIPDVIKIDVQDHERFVLLGAKNIIKNHRPTIIVETNNVILLEHFEEIIALFENYSVTSVEEERWVSLKEWKGLAEGILAKNILTIDYLLRPNQ